MDIKGVKKHFQSVLIALILIFFISAYTTTTSNTSDQLTFCNKYLAWSTYYKGWFEDEHCR